MNAISPILDAEPAEIELTILMPCLNEAETIGVCIAKAKDFLVCAGVVGEVLIADNGSTDGSQTIARDLGARVVDVAEKGYGAALTGGIAAARGRYTIMGDADDSYDFSALGLFVERLRAGADLVMGNRFKGGIEPGAMPFLHRYLGNPVLSSLGRLFFKIAPGDFHCGLRGFRTERIRALDLRTTGMEFASEMVVRSALAGLAIEEAPTTLKPDGRSRPPHLKTWRDGWRHLKFLLMYNPRWLFLIPGLSFCGLGVVLAAVLFYGPLQLSSNFQLDLNTFAAACFMIVVGAQLLSFGMLSRYYAEITGFLPPTRSSDWLMRTISTDRLALNAGICLAGGVGFFGYAVFSWASLGFGPLDNPEIPRIVLLGLTLIVIALQVFFSAFLLGVLEIPGRSRAQDRSAGRRLHQPEMIVWSAALFRHRLARFIIVGLGAAMLLFMLNWLFALLGMPAFSGGLAAYLIAFVAAYSCQHGWTFGGMHSHGRALPRYLAVQTICALGAGGMAYAAVHGLGASPAVMSAIVTLCASAASFVLSSLWVFPKQNHSTGSDVY